MDEKVHILLFYYYIPSSDIKMQSHEVPIKSLFVDI